MKTKAPPPLTQEEIDARENAIGQNDPFYRVFIDWCEQMRLPITPYKEWKRVSQQVPSNAFS